MISVIIPIYNAEEYLKRTFDCIRRQTLTDYEVILVDDGSTDGSGKICDDIARTDGRFRCIHQKNAGVSAARNLGLQHVSGQYVAFLDADDEIGRDYLEILQETILEDRAQMAVCDVLMIRDGQEIGRFSCGSCMLTGDEALSLLLSRKKINSGPYAKLFSREILKNISFPPLRVYEDILFIMEAMANCACVAVTDRTAYRYEQNEGGAMSKLQEAPSMDIITSASKILAFLKTRRGLSPECLYITVSHLMQYVQSLQKAAGYGGQNFIDGCRKLYRQHFFEIIFCSAFPWKEKLLYAAFSLGIHL